jgi:uncharacterized repeat protein (TIGR01451 family)
MKKRIGFLIVLVLLGGLWLSAQVNASHVDAFTFFIPYPTDSLAAFFLAGGQVQPTGFSVASIEHTISISVLRNNTIIYYDQWEDGLETNILFPTQASTEVWGDNNPGNGAPPNIPGDVLSAGEVITLQNFVPVPRSTADVRFDGGDKIVSAGGAIAVTLAAWPEAVATGYSGILFADAWELYPTSRWGTEYIIPIGENVNRPGGGFTIVSLNVQAVEDGTLVDLDLNGDGDFSDPGEVSGFMLNEGKQLTRVEGVNSGAEVRASGPVQVHIFAKDPASTFEARGYTMLPHSQWSDDYLAPRSSDGDFWLYNPDPTNPLVVQVETVAGTTTITLPAGGTGRYLPAPGLSSGVNFTSLPTDRRPFYGVAALDMIDDGRDDDQDWGYALLPISELATQALIGWAPGNNCNPPGPCQGGTGLESRVYVTAVNTTTVFVDYNDDGVADANYPVLPLAEVPITAPNFNLTGARLYTTNREPFIAVWGQDQSAPINLPSIDVGTNIVPLRAPSIEKGYTLIQEGYNCGTVVQGTTIRFELQAFNDSNLPIPDAIIGDTLQAGITYVPGSTRVRNVPINDSGNTPFPLDEGGYNIGTMEILDVVSITYEAVIQDAGLFNNQAEFVSPSADPASIEMTLPFRVVGYEVGKTLIDPSGVVSPGQVITFDLTITNTGNVTITNLPLRDTYDQNYLSYRNASVLPDNVDVVAGEISWNDLTGLGALPPTTTMRVSLSFDVVDPIPSGVISTTNVALAEGVQDSEGRTQAIMCGDANVSFAVPTPTSTPTSTPTPTPTSTPTPRAATPKSRTTPTSPTATPTPLTTISTPTATPTPPVLFLPETGAEHSSTLPWWSLALLPGLGLVVGWVVYRQRKR